MIFEAAQWATMLVIVLLMLGLYRQLSIALPGITASIAPGPDIGKKLPRSLLERLGSVASEFRAEGSVVIFVSENCSVCQRLLADIGRVLEDGGRLAPIAIVVRTPSIPFRASLEALGLPLVVDKTGAIWRSSGITSTPLVLQVDSDGRVKSREISHDIGSFATEAA